MDKLKPPSSTAVVAVILGLAVAEIFLPAVMDIFSSLVIAGAGFYLGRKSKDLSDANDSRV